MLIWFADAARVGQKNTIMRRWAKRGTRLSAPQDLRTASAYIFGAICPAQGEAAGLVLPRCTTEAMSLHLAEIAQAVAPEANAVLLLDQAGWHVSRKLKVPSNITLVPLPAKAPEFNPIENIWQFLRDNWISNRVFTSYTDVLDHCCAAWNNSLTNLRPSCPSAYAIGPMYEDQRRLVYAGRNAMGACKPDPYFSDSGAAPLHGERHHMEPARL